jgi:hypothetical protein
VVFDRENIEPNTNTNRFFDIRMYADPSASIYQKHSIGGAIPLALVDYTKCRLPRDLPQQPGTAGSIFSSSI